MSQVHSRTVAGPVCLRDRRLETGVLSCPETSRADAYFEFLVWSLSTLLRHRWFSYSCSGDTNAPLSAPAGQGSLPHGFTTDYIFLYVWYFNTCRLSRAFPWPQERLRPPALVLRPYAGYGWAWDEPARARAAKHCTSKGTISIKATPTRKCKLQ